MFSTNKQLRTCAHIWKQFIDYDPRMHSLTFGHNPDLEPDFGSRVVLKHKIIKRTQM